MEEIRERGSVTSLVSSDQHNGTKSVFSEAVRIGALYALTKTAVNKSGFLKKSSGGKKALALGLATGIASIFNEDNDVSKSLGGALLLAGVSKTASAAAFHNVDKIQDVMTKLNHSIHEWSLAKIDMKQRFEDYKKATNVEPRDMAMFPSVGELKSIPDFFLSGASNKKSKAFLDYEANKNVYKTLIKSKRNPGGYDPLRGKDADFIQKLIKREDGGNKGPFSALLKYSKVDGETGKAVLDYEELYKNHTDVGNVKRYFDANKAEIRKGMEQDSKFSLKNFINEKAKSENATEFDKSFKSYYNDLTANGDGVKVKDLIANDKSSLDLLNKRFGLEGEEDIVNLIGDVNVKQIGRSKQGNLYDKSVLDPMSIAIDAATVLEKSFRPVFSMLPGEKAASFSLMPFDLAGVKRKRGMSDFRILDNAEDIDDSLFNLEVLQQRNVFNTDLSDEARLTLDNSINREIDKLNSYKAAHGSIRNEAIEGIQAKGKQYRVNYETGELNSFNENSIAGFKTEIGKTSIINKDSNWETLEGLYDFSYDNVLKTNEFKKMNQFLAKDFTSFGYQHEEDYYFGDTLKGKVTDVLGKFKKNKDNSKVLNKELRSFVGKIETEHNDFYKQTAEAIRGNQDKVSAFGISMRKVDINDLDSIEKALRRTNTKSLKSGILENGFTMDDDLLKSISTMENSLSYFKVKSGSLNDIDDKIIHHAVREDFVSRLLKTGYDEDKIFSGYSELNKSLFQSTFINQPIATSTAVLHKKGDVVKAYTNQFFNKFNDSLNYIGIKKLDNMLGLEGIDPNIASASENFVNVMTKRIAPILLAGAVLQGTEGITDALLPGDTGVGGYAAKSLAALRVGFQVLMETTGIVGAANYMTEQGFGGFITPLELNLSSEEMYQQYFEGKEVEIKRGRNWFGGNRTSFEGTDTKEYRQHFLYRLQHRDKGIYKSKLEKLYREDLLPTKLLSRVVDPYLEERRAKEAGFELDKSEQLFSAVPIIGTLLSNTIGSVLKPTEYYTDHGEINPFLASFDRVIEDVKTMGGYQGYAISAASNFLLGGSSIAEVLANNFNVENRRLSSIDNATALNNKYYDLELGGLFGVTEPIRRIFTNSEAEIISTKQAKTGEEWFDNAMLDVYEKGNKSNVDFLKSHSMAPGKAFEKRYGLNSDNLGKYGLVDRMRILGNSAPWSKEYTGYEKQAKAKLKSGNLSVGEAKELRSIMSSRDNSVNRDTSISNKYISGAKTTNINLSIDSVIDSNMFMSGGKRYKLTGIETDFTKLSERLGSTGAQNELAKLKNFLQNADGGSFTVNKNATDAVSMDDDGAYVEVFSKDIASQFSKLKKTSYLEIASEGGIFSKAREWAFQNSRNVALAGQSFKNKSVTGRSAYKQWYRESLQMPSVRDWQSPIESFVKPMFELSEDAGVNSALIANTLTNMSGGISNVNPLLAGGMLGNYIGDKLGIEDTPIAYQKEDDTQMAMEMNKAASGEQSFFDLNTNSSMSDLKKSLTTSERHFFKSLVNTKDKDYQEEIYSVASDRFKHILDITRSQQYNYLAEDRIDVQAIDTTGMGLKKHFQESDDYFYNLARSKQVAGYDLSSIEKRRLTNSSIDHLQLNSRVDNDTRRNAFTKGRIRSKTISTIFGSRENNYVY